MPRKAVRAAADQTARNRRTATARRSGAPATRVYEALRARILDGELLPGTHLKQQSIADQMGTSQAPVISALSQLAQDGLVTHERGQGCRVSDLSLESIEDMLTVRRALETEAARLAARRAGPEDLEHLGHRVERMVELVRQGRRADADVADVEFHMAVARLARSPDLLHMLKRCHVLEVVHRRMTANECLGDFQNLAVNHRTLADAIASGDPDRAGKAMHAHLTSRPPSSGRGGANGQRAAKGL